MSKMTVGEIQSHLVNLIQEPPYNVFFFSRCMHIKCAHTSANKHTREQKHHEKRMLSPEAGVG